MTNFSVTLFESVSLHRKMHSLVSMESFNTSPIVFRMIQLKCEAVELRQINLDSVEICMNISNVKLHSKLFDQKSVNHGESSVCMLLRSNDLSFNQSQVASTVHTPPLWLPSIFSSLLLFADSNRWSVRCTQSTTNNTKRRRGHSQNAVNTRHNISIENVSTSKICSETLCRASPTSTKHLSPVKQPTACSDWHWQQQQQQRRHHDHGEGEGGNSSAEIIKKTL